MNELIVVALMVDGDFSTVNGDVAVHEHVIATYEDVSHNVEIKIADCPRQGKPMVGHWCHKSLFYAYSLMFYA